MPGNDCGASRRTATASSPCGLPSAPGGLARARDALTPVRRSGARDVGMTVCFVVHSGSQPWAASYQQGVVGHQNRNGPIPREPMPRRSRCGDRRDRLQSSRLGQDNQRIVNRQEIESGIEPKSRSAPDPKRQCCGTEANLGGSRSHSPLFDSLDRVHYVCPLPENGVAKLPCPSHVACQHVER